MNLAETKYLVATYNWAVMATTIPVSCKIHGWDDKSERFAISFYDHVMEDVEHRWVPYNHVTGWTWQSLLEKFVVN